jgi:TatD DNase family protein
LIVDTHCHIQDQQFDGDRAEVLARALAAGVGLIVAPATDAASARAALDLGLAGLPVRAAVGIHPNTIPGPGEWEQIVALAADPGVVAIGETGLDYYRGRERAADQRALFARHLGLAEALALPVVVHNREADEDVLAAIADWRAGGPDRVAVLHCFVGGPALAERALALGCYLGFGGPITFKSARAARETAAVVPLDRVLLETDAPYLAPTPHRGHRNEPSYVRLVLERLVELRGLDFGKVATQTHDNAVQVFGQRLLGANRPLAWGRA